MSVQSDRNSKIFPEGTVITVSEIDARSTEPLIHPFDHTHRPSSKTKRCQGRFRSNSLQKLRDTLSKAVENVNSSSSANEKLSQFAEFDMELNNWTLSVATKSLKEAVNVFECANRNTSSDDINYAFQAFCAAKLLVACHRREKSLHDLTSAITKFELACELPFNSQLEKPIYLLGLGDALLTRYQETDDPADIEKSLQYLESSVPLIPANHPVHHRISQLLAKVYSLRFLRTKSHEDITKAVNLQETVLNTAQTATNLRLQTDLLISRLTAFPTSYSTDLDRAIHLATESVDLSKDGSESPDIHAACLNSFAAALAARTLLERPTVELTRLIVQTQDDAVTVCPGNSPVRGKYLCDLATSLVLHFRTAGEERCLDRGIEVLKLAGKCAFESERERLEVLLRLSGVFISRFKISGNTKDLTKAIENAERAVKGIMSAGLSGDTRIRGLRDLGLALYTRHLKTESKSDLDRTIVVFATAIGVQGDGNEGSGLTGFLDSALRDWLDRGAGEVEGAFEEMTKNVRKYSILNDTKLVLGVILEALKDRKKAAKERIGDTPRGAGGDENGETNTG